MAVFLSSLFGSLARLVTDRPDEPSIDLCKSDLLNLEEIWKIKFGVWRAVDQESGRLLYIKRCTTSELALTMRLSEIVKNKNYSFSLLFPKVVATSADVLPQPFRQAVLREKVGAWLSRSPRSRPCVLVMEALPIGTLPDQKGWADIRDVLKPLEEGPSTVVFSQAIGGKPINFSEITKLYRDFRKLNNLGIIHCDYGGNVFVDCPDGETIRMGVIDFDPSRRWEFSSRYLDLYDVNYLINHGVSRGGVIYDDGSLARSTISVTQEQGTSCQDLVDALGAYYKNLSVPSIPRGARGTLMQVQSNDPSLWERSREDVRHVVIKMKACKKRCGEFFLQPDDLALMRRCARTLYAQEETYEVRKIMTVLDAVGNNGWSRPIREVYTRPNFGVRLMGEGRRFHPVERNLRGLGPHVPH